MRAVACTGCHALRKRPPPHVDMRDSHLLSCCSSSGHWSTQGLETDYLGAQFMGTVQAVGTGVKNVAAGDRVVACFDIGCGRCFQCKQARPSLLLLKVQCRANPHGGLALVWLYALLPVQAGRMHLLLAHAGLFEVNTG